MPTVYYLFYQSDTISISSVLCESSSGDNNNNNNNNNAPATDSTIGIIIGVVVLIVVLVVVTAVLVGVKVKRNRSTHHDSTPHGPSNTDVPITCKYPDTSHHNIIQYIQFLKEILHLCCNTV